LACQFVSAFLWVLMVLIVNFFVLHHSNSTPQAEARLMEPETAFRPPDLPQPAPRPLPRPRVQLVSESYEKLFDEDHKPNYYFLYRDQIRFIEVSPKKKILVAKRKEPEPLPVTPEEPPPEPKPLRLEWMDMALLEEREKEEQRPEPLEEPPPRALPKQVKVVMVQDLDMDLKIQKDVSPDLIPESPEKVPQATLPKTRVSVQDMDMSLEIDKERPQPILPEEPKKAPQAALAKVRVAAANMDMNMVEQPAPKKIVREIVHMPEPRTPAMVSASSADYVSLPMEISPRTTSAKGAGKPKSPSRKEAPQPLTRARGTSVPMSDIPMSLETEGRPTGRSKASSSPPTKAKIGGAGLVAVNNNGAGGFNLPVGLLEGDSAKGKGRDTKVAASPSPAPAKMILRNAGGSIALGTPLAFKLADVGDETSSGNKYIQMSAQIKRLMEGNHMPSQTVTLALENSTGRAGSGQDPVMVSYCRNQIVLQYANGKQQVVTLVSGEPFPRFELRRTGSGGESVPVGTKLEEIVSCITTFKNVLRE